jgi:hypothetical protein
VNDWLSMGVATLGMKLGSFVIGIALLARLGLSACSSEEPGQERQAQIAAQSESGRTQSQVQSRQEAEPAETVQEQALALVPDVIIIAQPIEFGAEEFRQSLFDDQALAEVPAIKNGAVHVVESKHFTTFSYWKIRGAEDLARILWPDDFPDPPAQGFSLAGQE